MYRLPYITEVLHRSKLITNRDRQAHDRRYTGQVVHRSIVNSFKIDLQIFETSVKKNR